MTEKNNTEEIKALLEADRRERAERAWNEIQQILARERMKLDAQVTINGDGVHPAVRLVPLE